MLSARMSQVNWPNLYLQLTQSLEADMGCPMEGETLGEVAPPIGEASPEDTDCRILTTLPTPGQQALSCKCIWDAGWWRGWGGWGGRTPL